MKRFRIATCFALMGWAGCGGASRVACEGKPSAPESTAQPPPTTITPQTTEGETTTMAEAPNKATEPTKLLEAALKQARSQDAPDHTALLQNLEDASFLDRLDTQAEMLNLRFRTRIERVVEALAANPSPTAHKVLVSLMGSAVFKKEDRRTDALIRASSVLRPPEPAVVQFWEAHSKPSDGFTNLTIAAVVDNGAPDAVKVFEHRLVDPAHDEDEKGTWLHGPVLSHRNDEALLLGCERLLGGALSPALKSELIDSLFDYRPDEWYGEVKVYTPPDRAKATPAAQATLERIAKLVLTKLHPTKRQEDAIEKATGLTRKKLANP